MSERTRSSWPSKKTKALGSHEWLIVAVTTSKAHPTKLFLFAGRRGTQLRRIYFFSHFTHFAHRTGNIPVGLTSRVRCRPPCYPWSRGLSAQRRRAPWRAPDPCCTRGSASRGASSSWPGLSRASRAVARRSDGASTGAGPPWLPLFRGSCIRPCGKGSTPPFGIARHCQHACDSRQGSTQRTLEQNLATLHAEQVLISGSFWSPPIGSRVSLRQLWQKDSLPAWMAAMVG